MSDQTVISYDPKLEVNLPHIIKLEGINTFLKLRSIPAVMRIHKVKEQYNPHEFFYSELLLYRPWRKEEDPISSFDSILSIIAPQKQ